MYDVVNQPHTSYDIQEYFGKENRRFHRVHNQLNIVQEGDSVGERLGVYE